MAEFQDCCIKLSQHSARKIPIPTRSNFIPFSNKLSGRRYGKNREKTTKKCLLGPTLHLLIKTEVIYAHISEVPCIFKIVSAECLLIIGHLLAKSFLFGLSSKKLSRVYGIFLWQNEFIAIVTYKVGQAPALRQ